MTVVPWCWQWESTSSNSYIKYQQNELRGFLFSFCISWSHALALGAVESHWGVLIKGEPSSGLWFWRHISQKFGCGRRGQNLEASWKLLMPFPEHGRKRAGTKYYELRCGWSELPPVFGMKVTFHSVKKERAGQAEAKLVPSKSYFFSPLGLGPLRFWKVINFFQILKKATISTSEK